MCYVGTTGEVLDEFLAPGNRTAMSALPEMLRGLNEVIPKGDRGQVLLRGDAHFGTAVKLSAIRQAGYHYLCPLFSYSSKTKLKKQLCGRPGRWIRVADAAGQEHHLQCWQVRRWPVRAKRGRGEVRPRAVVYRERRANGDDWWTVLLTDVKRMSVKRMWPEYQRRNGTIEEYNDQSERAYHLEVMRTGNFAGLNALLSLVGLCWNLTRWATAEFRLPPVASPSAAPLAWMATSGMDLSQLIERARYSGLRLDRAGPRAVLEVEDTAGTAESEAWLRLLRQPIQRLLRWAG